MHIDKMKQWIGRRSGSAFPPSASLPTFCASLFGSLLFISDNVDEYNEEQKRLLYNTFAEKDVTIQRAELIRENVMDIDYCENGTKKSLRFNVQTGRSEE